MVNEEAKAGEIHTAQRPLPQRGTTFFLDFDGVLHPEYCPAAMHFVHRPALEALLRQHLRVQIVISSTWRLQYAATEILARFSPDIASRIVGMTPEYASLKAIPDRLIGYPRHAECWEWQRIHAAASDDWIALDDRPWLFYPLCPQLVQVDGSKGIDEDVLRRLLERLER